MVAGTESPEDFIFVKVGVFFIALYVHLMIMKNLNIEMYLSYQA